MCHSKCMHKLMLNAISKFFYEKESINTTLFEKKIIFL